MATTIIPSIQILRKENTSAACVRACILNVRVRCCYCCTINISVIDLIIHFVSFLCALVLWPRSEGMPCAFADLLHSDIIFIFICHISANRDLFMFISLPFFIVFVLCVCLYFLSLFLFFAVGSASIDVCRNGRLNNYVGLAHSAICTVHI